MDTMSDCALDTMVVLCTAEHEDTIRIRVSNVSDFVLENIVVNFVGDEVFYGSLEPSDSTEYECYDYAWSIAVVELSIMCDSFKFQPIDAVGERILENGRHTLEVNALDTGGYYDRLRIKVVDDE